MDLKKQINTLANWIKNCERKLQKTDKQADDINKIITAEVATRLAYMYLDVPADGEISAKFYYDNNLSNLVHSLVSGVNEQVLISVNSIIVLTFTVWLTRYDLLHGQGNPKAILNYLYESDRITGEDKECIKLLTGCKYSEVIK